MGGRSNRDKGRERESGQKEHKIAGEIKTDRDGEMEAGG